MTTTVSIAEERKARKNGIDGLRERINGEIILPGDDQYQEAREMRGFTYDNYPSFIVKCTNATDVAESVKFARANRIPFSVRGGGHSVPGLCVVDGAMTIDMTQMRGVEIFPERQVARVQGGARSIDLAIPAHEHGLALSTGDTGTVGFGGLVTGGGIGYFVRKYGLAADRLRSAKIVTADGEIITASPLEHSDLFWAIRGGGGNFGIVVEFEFELVPVSHIYGGALILPATREVVRGYLDYVPNAPDGLTTMATIVAAPPAPFVPDAWVGKPVVLILVAFTGDLAEGPAATAPLRALAEPVADVVDTLPYPAMFQFMAFAEERHGAAIRMMFTDEIPDATIDDMIEGVNNAAGPMCGVHLRGMGGELARIPLNSTAFAHRERKYFVALLGLWMDPAEDGDAIRSWTDELWSKIAHIRDGVYVNFLEREGEARVHEAYPNEVYARLAEIKAKYDPGNVFRYNQNIRPEPVAQRAAA